MTTLQVAARRLHSPRIWTLAALALGAAGGAGVALGGPAPALLLIVAAAAVFATVRLPGVVLAAYMLIPVYKGFVQPYSPIDITALLAALNVAQAVPIVIGRRLQVTRASIALWVAVAALVLFGVLYAPSPALAMNRAANFWGLVFVPLLPACVRVASDSKAVRQLLWSLLAVGGLTTLVGLAGLGSAMRLSVLAADTIDTARITLLVPIVGILFAWREPSRLLRGAAVVLTPAAVLVAVGSGSRGPLLMLVVLVSMGVARTMLRPRLGDWQLITLGAVAAVVSALLVSVAVPDLPAESTQRIGDLGQAFASGIAVSAGAIDPSRIRLYGLALSLFAGQPLFGTGTAGFEALSGRYLGSQLADAYPHNALLQFGAEYGLVGVTLFSAAVLYALLRKQERGNEWNAFKWLAVYFFLNAMVSGNILTERTLWALLLLLLVSPGLLSMHPRSAGSDPIFDGEPGGSARSPEASLASVTGDAPPGGFAHEQSRN